MTKSNLIHALTLISMVTLVGSELRAQDPAAEAKLMLELERAVPRKTQTTGVPLASAVNWEATVDKIGEILTRASDTKVEPHALYLLGCSLYNTDSIEQAEATFRDLKNRFPDHPLCVRAKDPISGKTLVDDAIEDCAIEAKFRQEHKVHVLPAPVLDPDSTTTLHLTTGDVKIQFYKDVAPKHRANFLKLARSGYYDRTRVHRVVPGYLIALGDPTSRDPDFSKWGKGGPDYVLENEFSRASHRKGTVTMWRGPGRPSSHGSQFQILLTDQPHLDFVQTPFAEVVAGLDVVDTTSRAHKNQHESPIEDCFVNGITTPSPK